MTTHQDHPDLAKIEDAQIREQIAQVFRDAENGTPDNISEAGCLDLAKKGAETWNAWREAFPVHGQRENAKNIVSFADVDFRVNSNKTITFSKFQFGRRANFERCNFNGKNSFHDSVFGDNTSFMESIFHGLANFRASMEKGGTTVKRIDFENCVFKGNADFSNRNFLGDLNFQGSQFKKLAIFHGCELHQNTSFDEASFPNPTGSQDAARAYRTLKLAFNKQQAIREEQRFFKLEMEEETLRETGAKRWLFKAYKVFSDFGFSVTRPLLLALGALLIFAALYGAVSWLTMCHLANGSCQFTPAWLEFSILQALPVPGLDKWSDALRAEFLPVQGWASLLVTAFVILHKAVSLLALFLIGLALRNLFKLK